MRLSVLFGSQGTWTLLLSHLEERERTGAPAPASQDCRGLKTQGSNHGKPRLQGAADSDKSFIPCYAFPYGTGTNETSFRSETTVLPLLLVPKPLGQNWVADAVARKNARGLTLLRPCLCQERENGRLKWGGTTRPVAGRQCLS